MYILTAYIKEALPFYRERAIHKVIRGLSYYIVILNEAEYMLMLLKLDVVDHYVSKDKRGIYCSIIGMYHYESKKYYNAVEKKLCT